MSFDDFDPAIERLFNRAPDLADSQSFDARVMARLQSSSRVRTVVLSIAGLVGGFVAFNELLGVSFKADAGRLEASSVDNAEGVGSAITHGGQAIHGVVTSLGLERFDLASMSHIQLFWGVASVLLAALTLGAVKLYQQV